jgi:hypothetical protein
MFSVKVGEEQILEIFFYYTFRKVLSTRRASETMIRIHEIHLPLVLYGYKTWSLILEK